MIKVNRNYLKLKSSYLFSEISKRVASFQAASPGTPIISRYVGARVATSNSTLAFSTPGVAKANALTSG